MLNKNDPLIGAVQQVMQQSNAEREATRLVNEAFGVEDRKALPHEYQAEWDAVYKTVLTEGVEALDEASLPKPPTSVKAVKALGMDERRSRAKAHKAEAKKHKDVYDTHHKRGSHGTQTAQKALDRYTHHNDMADRYLNPSSHFQNEKNRERDFSDGGVKVYNEAKIDHPNKRKLDVAEPYGRLTKKDFSTLRAMGEEENFDKAKKMPLLIKKKQKPVQPTPMPNAPLKPKAGAYKLQKLEEDHLDEELLAIQEEIAYNLAEQAEYVYENYGEEGLVEFIDSLTEEQYELLYMNEGVWDYVKDRAGKAWDATKSAASTAGSALASAASTAGKALASAGDTALSMTNPIYRVGKAIGGAIKKDYDSYEKSKETPKYTGNVKYTPASAASQRGASTSGMGQARQGAAFQFTDDEKKGKVSAERLKQWQSAQGESGSKLGLGNFMNAAKGKTAVAGGKNDAAYQQKIHNTQRKELNKVNESIRNIIAERYAGQQGAGGAPAVRPRSFLKPDAVKSGGSMPTSGVASTRLTAAGSMNPFDRRNDMQRATQNAGAMAIARNKAAAPRPGERVPGEKVGTNAQLTAQARARQGFGAPAGGNYKAAQTKAPKPNVTGIEGNPMGDYNPGQEYSTPTSPQSQAQSNMSPTVKTRPDLPVARKKAEPIKVSDTEVMNDPKFKKAVSSVGGTQAAKKIQTGERVAGLGRFNKGDTIMSRVRTDIAARKNVGRES